MRKTELLIPAGSLDVLKTAVIYGADAVYLGGEAFGLRAKAKNFTNEEIMEGIKFAHDHGVKVYITANILAHNDDLAGVEKYFEELKTIRPDALIISDPGVFAIARRVLPEMELHISTQANNTNYGTYLFWHQLGAKRVVSARELSLKEIREIREHIPEDMEIESFIHGAMCISRYNQPAAEDVLGFSSFSENSLLPAALDGPSGTVGTCIAMKSVGSTERLLRGGDTVLLDIPCGWRGYHTDKSITFYFGDLDENPKADLIRAAHEQAVALEKLTAELMRPGAVPAEIYAKVLETVEPTFRDGFMNGCKFLGHSIGLTMDESPVLAKGFNEPLETGMTIAVEPKIALPGIGLIGTENTYEVVADGSAKSLTGAYETGLEINY